jgi:hypothetical protein
MKKVAAAPAAARPAKRAVKRRRAAPATP